MISERTRKKIAREHSERLSAGDIDGLLELYADDATFEDPVGAGGQAGREALRAHFETLVAANARETIEDSVVAQDGEQVLAQITAVMDYRPCGPVYADRGWLPAPEGEEPSVLRRRFALLLRLGESGLIEEMRAYWGRPDVETSADGAAGSFRGCEALSPREEAVRQLPYTYARRLEAGDVEGTVALFTDDVVFEDPVGVMKLRGKDALRKHVAHGSAGKVNEILARPVSSMDERFVVIRGDARIFVPEKMRMRMITICELNEECRGVHIQGFWGLTDTTFGDDASGTDT
ncbi:nuclear transport factor 2 family protein [Streptomyces sp. 6N223]|uniref:nuclear transport factor 2 family protein n=1 Tax=Streptomyces sp. 6N223 TaxID=3457412 RepID=UPI003FD556BC